MFGEIEGVILSVLVSLLKIYSLKEELFNLRRRKAVGQLEHGEEVRRVRKDIARAYMVQRERELGVK